MRRVNVPTVLQLEAVECGAASLAMILAYHGKHVSLEQLRIACGVSRDGTKAVNILKAARAMGFTAKGYRKEPDDLKDIPLPAILFWNFNHFVVLEGMGRGCAYLNDPARGKTKVDAAEFDRSFTGVVLTFETTRDFRPGGQPPRLWRSLAARLPGSRFAILYLILATAALAVPGLIAPGFQRIFIDNVLIGSARSWLGPLLIAMAGAAVATAMLTWLQQRALLRLEMRLALDGSSRFLRHVLSLPVEFFLQRSAADISSRVHVNDRVAGLLSGDLATSAVSVLTAGLYAALMFRYDTALAALGVAIALANLAALRLLSRRRLEASERLQQDRGRLLGTSMNGLLSIETLKSTGSEADFFAKWSGLQAAVVNREQTQGAGSVIGSAFPELLLALGNAAVLYLGGLRVMDGALTMGLLVAFQALLRNFLTPVNQLVNTGGSLPEAHAGMRRLDDVLRYPRDKSLDRAGDESEPRKLTGRVELRGVTFGYNRLEPPLIEGFTLTIEPGRRVALVGGSGSGKSTVARIVAGLYEPWTGEVLFDGKPRGEHSRAAMSASLATVDQEIFLFEGTVRENLTLWDNGVDTAVMLEAARDACIHEEIAARPGGYDSRVEESGRNFSGGQRQRLEIARALTGEPRILVMDEATSALDPATEMLVGENLRRRGCACLIVAHRLSTVRDCDEIIVMDRGRVIERGTHEQLSAAKGAYARLISAV